MNLAQPPTSRKRAYPLTNGESRIPAAYDAGGTVRLVVLLRPRWLAGHVVVTALVALFLALGFWQWGRHRDTGADRDLAREEYALPAPEITTLTPPPGEGARAQASGTYDRDRQVLLRGRARDGASGYDVLTVLTLDDGTNVLVDRGWIPRVGAARRLSEATPPDAPVRVIGLARPSRGLRPGEELDAVDGIPSTPRVDLDALAAELGVSLHPIWIEAQHQGPSPAAGDPALPDPPDAGTVNHLSYALQWFSFAAIGIIGWTIVCVRLVRRGRPAPSPSPA